jgi:uncharacterized protein (DUF433 family)
LETGALRTELELVVQNAYVLAMKTWIVSDPEHLGGNPRVRDTKIPISLVVESIAAGMSIREVVDPYPSLTEEAVKGVLHEAAEMAV